MPSVTRKDEDEGAEDAGAARHKAGLNAGMAGPYPDARSRRLRLDAALDRLAHCNAILVSAPAGYGKSVLLARWRRLLIGAGRTVIWVPGRAEMSLRDIVAQICGEPETALTDTSEDLARRLQACLGSGDRGISIVTDDLDRITDPAVLAGLALMLACLPRGTQWLFASRQPVPRTWLGLFAYASIGLVTESQLSFTTGEAAELMADGHDPRAGDLAAGVPLFLELARKQGGAHVTPDLAADVSCWLDAHVWPLVPDDIRTAIDTLSLAGDVPLTAALVDALIGRSDGMAVLDTLRHQTPLTRQMGDDLRFHPVAASVLPIAPLDPAHRIAIHRRAADWLSDVNPQAAIGHALAAGEAEQAYRLIEQELRNAVSRGRVAQALDWLRALPADALAERGGMDATIAWALAICGRPAESETWLDEATKRNPAFALGGFDALLRALLATQRDDLDETMRHLHRLDAAQIATLPPQFEAVRRNLVRGIALQAGEAWLPGVAVRLPPGDPRRDPRHFYSLCFAAYRDVESALDTGHAREAIRQIEPLSAEARRNLGADSAAAFILAAGLGAAHWQAGNVTAASALLADLRIERENWALPSSIWLMVRTRARIARDAGDVASAIEMVERFVEDAGARSLHRFCALALTELARFHAAAGSPAQLRSSIDRLASLQAYDMGPLQRRQIRLTLAIATAHAAIFDRNWPVAMDALRCGHVVAGRLRRAFVGAEVELLCEGLPIEAPRPRLTRRRMLPLIDQPDREMLARELQASPARPQPGTRHAERAGPEITAKEREVLELVAAGVGNKLIAQALMVSPETVKWHLKNIFNKLDVHDRRNVVARARELAIID